jgi:RNA polymerase sigma factor (sigma-70 family)
MVTPAVEPNALIQQIAAQARDAFSQFYDRYCSLVYSLALRMLRAQSDAEDLLQEVFMQIWRQAANYNRDRGTPEAWIVNIGRSRAIDNARPVLRQIDRRFHAKARARKTRTPKSNLTAPRQQQAGPGDRPLVEDRLPEVNRLAISCNRRRGKSSAPVQIVASINESRSAEDVPPSFSRPRLS